MEIKYVHTNLIAKDWRKLSGFYTEVFGCAPVYPERDLYGEWADEMTGIKDVRIRGVHLRLPGCEDGTTLEIFEYEPAAQRMQAPQIHLAGFGHIAFHTDSVEALLDKVLKHGGEKLGDIVSTEIPGVGLLTVVYARDPEGNFIEIQNWKKA